MLYVRKFVFMILREGMFCSFLDHWQYFFSFLTLISFFYSILFFVLFECWWSRKGHSHSYSIAFYWEKEMASRWSDNMTLTKMSKLCRSHCTFLIIKSNEHFFPPRRLGFSPFTHRVKCVSVWEWIDLCICVWVLGVRMFVHVLVDVWDVTFTYSQAPPLSRSFAVTRKPMQGN
jgi:hypothetical protein